jgi:hypothetical protein
MFVSFLFGVLFDPVEAEQSSKMLVDFYQNAKHHSQKTAFFSHQLREPQIQRGIRFLPQFTDKKRSNAQMVMLSTCS